MVTAGSASGICDGAETVILVTKDGIIPLARIVGYSVARCEPTIMCIGPVPAIGAMLEKTGVSLGEVDQIEINEAFAAQALSCQKPLDITKPLDTCSGSRISIQGVHKLRREGQKYGIGSASIGGGQGIAIQKMESNSVRVQ